MNHLSCPLNVLLQKHLDDKYENSSHGKRASVHMAMNQFRALSPPASLSLKKKAAILKISMKIVLVNLKALVSFVNLTKKMKMNFHYLN